MTFWDHLFDNDYRQRTDIEALRRKANTRNSATMRNRRDLEEHHQRIEKLEQHVGELALICRTLMTLLREQGTFSPEELQEVMNRIDLEDGVADGRISHHPKDAAKPQDDPTIAPQIRTNP